LVVGVATCVVIVGIAVVGNAFTNRPNCSVAAAEQVHLVSASVETGQTASAVSNAWIYGPVTLNYANDNVAKGYLLAAQTPNGIGVWAMNIDGSGATVLRALNGPAHLVANGGSDVSITVPTSDLDAAAACLSSNLVR
jgi:hypothetical protein